MTPSIARNTAFMTIASVAQKLISFVYFTLIARSVGVEGTGKYFIALSFTTLFVVLVDLGMTNVLVRESARVKEHMQRYVSTVLSVKMFLGVFAYVLVIIVSHFLDYDIETKNMILLSGVTMLFDSFHLTVYGVLRAIGDLRFESVSITASQFLSLLLGGIFLFFHLPLIYLILAFTIPSALNAIFASIMLHRKYKIHVVPKFEKEIFFYLGRITIPFALAAVFARVYSYIDSILLKQILGDEAVGWYSTPYKITYAFQFIPLALTAALYPRFSEYFLKEKEKLAVVFQDAMKYLLIMAVPVAIGISILAQDIILFLYKEAFLPSVMPLRILIISLIFSFLSFPIGACLNACNKQSTQTSIVGGVMVLNIILNLLLIPLYQVSGAAVAALCGNIVLTVCGYLFIHKIAPISHLRILKNILQIGVAGGVMGVAVWLSNLSLHFTFSIVIGALVYGIMLFVTRAITVAEVQEAIHVFTKKK